MDQYINIDKNEIPYRFEMELRGEFFEFEIGYNDQYDFFTLAVYKDGEFLGIDKLVYGRKLFLDIEDVQFPKVDLIPIDPSGIESSITFKNFNGTVFIEVIE